MLYKTALIVGRFQPFHKGHLFLIREALKKADKIIIGIGSSNITDVNNPIDFETRKKVIKAVFYKEGISEKLLKIVPLDDYFDDKKWLENLKKQVGDFYITLGHNDWTNNILEKAGYRVLRINYYKRELYEGWRIRKLIKEGKKWQDRVPKYLVDFVTNYPLQPIHYNHVVLGGTFDHFHKGHKALLEKALEVGKKVTVGIATEKLYENKLLSNLIEDFSTRKTNLTKFLFLLTCDDRHKIVKIVAISEFTGGIDKRSEVDAIVVSRETFQNALKINELRKQNHLKPLMIVMIEDVLAEDGGLISSERVRAGEIDRNGKLYELPTNHYLKMPETLRSELQKPLGKVLDSVHKVIKFIKLVKPTMTISVGDIITYSLLKAGIDPDVKVIDFKSRRRPIRTDTLIKDSLNRDCHYLNNPGTINLKTAEKLKQLIRLRSVLNKVRPYKESPYESWLVVEGEEDLLTLPAILFAPLNSLVLYGHWQLGIVAVEIDEKIKKKVRKFLEKFT